MAAPARAPHQARRLASGEHARAARARVETLRAHPLDVRAHAHVPAHLGAAAELVLRQPARILAPAAAVDVGALPVEERAHGLRVEMVSATERSSRCHDLAFSFRISSRVCCP